MAVLKRAQSAAESAVWDPKGLPPDRAWIKRHIAQYLNAEAGREIKQRDTSQHLTAYLLEFKRGQFPGKYLDRAPASRLTQFAANRFPCSQYLARFGISEGPPSCDRGYSCEDRDHLLFECPRFATARRKLIKRLEKPLSVSRIFDHLEELSEFVEAIAKQWSSEELNWGSGPTLSLKTKPYTACER